MLATDTPFRQFFDLDGSPLSNGYLYYGVADQNPEIAPITVYWDTAGTIPAVQPIRTVNGYPTRNGTPAAVYASGDYSLTVRSQRRELVSFNPSSLDWDNASQVLASVQQLTTDLAATTATDEGGGIVGHNGTINYPHGTVGGHLRGFVSPLDAPWLAPDDEIADATTAISAVVAHALATGKVIVWPDLTFVTSSTIPNLHDVKHIGPGIIKRGSDLFYVDPRNTQTNHLYVNKATGISTNDGLSASQPFDEPQNALLAIKKYGPIVGGTWQIDGASGTYTTRFDFRFKTVNPVRLVGPSWVTAPTLILDGASSAANMMTVRDGASLYIENIKVQNCTDNNIEAIDYSLISAVAIHSTGAGISTSSGSNFYAANHSSGDINGKCLLDNCASSEGVIIAYGNSIVSVGTTGTGVSDSPTISNSTRLVNAQHSSLVKLRWAFLDTGTFGCYSSSGSHVSHENGSVNACTIAYFGTHPEAILMNLSAVTITNCTSLRYAAAVEGVQERPIETGASLWRRTNLYVAADMAATVTSGTSPTTFMTAAMALLAADFNRKGRGMKVRIHGTIAGTAGTKTLAISGSVGGSIHSVVTVAADVGNFIAELSCTCLTTQTPTVSVLNEGGIYLDERSSQVSTVTTTDNLAAAQNISVIGTCSSGADSITVVAIETFEAGL